MSTATLTALLVELPLVWLSLSQGAFTVAVQFDVPLPGFHRANNSLGGLDAPWTAVKWSEDGLNDKLGLAWVQEVQVVSRISSSAETRTNPRTFSMSPLGVYRIICHDFLQRNI
jgi:hypothetical protein